LQGFSNADGLYLHHRGVWDEILHKRLAEIESDTIANAIVASAYTDSLYPDGISAILVTMFKLQTSTPLVPDVCMWLETTSADYFYASDAMHRKLLLEFLGDPIRAGKYVVDGTKLATLAKILLDYLVRPPDNKDTQRQVP